MTPSLSMRLLGDFSLVVNGAPVNMAGTPRLQSLLAYLALHYDAPQDRSQVAFLLWPDSTEGQAHANLRKSLFQLRQLLPEIESFLHVNRHTLQWRVEAPWSLDVRDFEEACSEAKQAEQGHEDERAGAALSKAVHLYRGDLLPQSYDEWLLPERDWLRQMFLLALDRLGVLLEQERDYDAAIQIAQQLLRHDPLQEETYRRLMRLYALRGDRTGALRVYHSCATTLERELGAEPSEATRQAYESLLRLDTDTPAAMPSPRGGEAPLVGRKQEWDQLLALWRRAAAGHPQMVVFSGEAGIGKTRLAEELLTWVGRQGIATASAHCYAAGQSAYAPIASWLRADAARASLREQDALWLTEISRLVPELLTERPDLPQPQPLTESWQRLRFLEALARALLHIADTPGYSRQREQGQRAPLPPLLLLLDDLQWCDQETLEWLSYLFHYAPRAPLLIAGTIRAEEVLPTHPLVAFLGALQREGLLTEIALGPLSTGETAALAEHTAGRQLQEAITRHLYDETEGNPLFIVEMVRAGTPEQCPHEQREGEALPLLLSPASTLPPTVQTVLEARLAQLSPFARELANLAAVTGYAFSVEFLTRASGSSEEEVVQALDELWQRRIVRELDEGAGNTYDFTHDKLREKAYVTLSNARRRFLHKRVAEALLAVYQGDLDAVSGKVAAHYEGAGLPQQAIPYYRRAAEVAQRIYASAEAIAALQRAIALLDVSPWGDAGDDWSMAAALHECLGDVLDVTGQHVVARESYTQALAYVPAEEACWQARLNRKIARTWNFPPQPEIALTYYHAAEEILQRAEAQSDEAWAKEWMQTQIEQLHSLYMLARVDEMAAVIESTRPMVERIGTATQRFYFFAYVALNNAQRARYVISDDILADARRAVAMSHDEEIREAGDRSRVGFARFALSLCLLLHGDLNQAEDGLQEAKKLGEQIGDPELIWRCRSFLLFVYRLRGQVEAVRQELRGWNEYTPITVAHRAWLSWRDGDLDQTERHGQEVLQRWRYMPFVYSFQWTGLWPMIAVAFARQRLAEAIDYVRMLLAPEQQLPPASLLPLLEKAIQAWEAGRQDAVCSSLEEALAIARELCYA